MVDWKNIGQKVSGIVKQRGGPKSVAEDAQELEHIAQGGGSTSEKAKEAAQAIKEPGAHQEGAGAPPADQQPPPGGQSA